MSLLVVAAAVAIASTAPLSTKRGVDYRVSSLSVPAYVKVFGFVERNYHYERLASQITAGITGDRERVLAVFEWTRTNIRRVPSGWPVVDDHIWNIIIRGYGAGDQRADVFATLCTYADVPAFWEFVSPADSSAKLPLSFALIQGRWRVVDVDYGFIFRDESGSLLDVDHLQAHLTHIESMAGDTRPGGVPYVDYFREFRPLAVPSPLRAELQMPWRRLRHEIADLARW